MQCDSHVQPDSTVMVSAGAPQGTEAVGKEHQLRKNSQELHRSTVCHWCSLVTVALAAEYSVCILKHRSHLKLMFG